MQNFTAAIPLSLYIHLPWCVRKCPYCDFNSHQAPAELPEKQYVKALIRDLDAALPLIWGRRFVSIFFGGGTPSLFSPAAIQEILTAIHSRIPFHTDLEITLEANPGTLDESRFHGFRIAGVNRISLGVQSLEDTKLKKLGRIHGREQALRALTHLKQAGFENFNIDIMHGLPEQTVEDALSDLQTALDFKPTHLSWYQLTLEPNTLFHHQPPTLPEEDILFDIQEKGKNLLTKNSMNQYEVSAYSQANRECQHNLNYWEFGDYLGIGAGAHSKITDFSTGKVSRFYSTKNPRSYLQDAGITSRTLDTKELIFEFMLNALRLTKGFSLEIFQERTGLSSECIASRIELAKQKGLLLASSNVLIPSPLGQRFLNDLVAIFLE